MMRYYLVCYDIEDDRRRDRVARCLKRWGRRVQFSVFEVACRSESDFGRLCSELESIKDGDDSVRVYRFNQATRRSSGELNGPPMRHCPAVVVL